MTDVVRIAGLHGFLPQSVLGERRASRPDLIHIRPAPTGSGDVELTRFGGPLNVGFQLVEAVLMGRPSKYSPRFGAQAEEPVQTTERRLPRSLVICR
jgi:hypothetical protein